MPPSNRSLGVLLAAIRRQLGLSQGEIHNASGISQPAQSNYETGKSTPSPATVRKWLHAVGRQPSVLPAASFWLRQLDAAAGAESDPFALQREYLALEAGQRTGDAFRSLMSRLTAGEESPTVPWEVASPRAEEYAESEVLWVELSRCPEEDWSHLFTWSSAVRHWGLCVRLCEASVQEAGDQPGRALFLAQKSVELAAMVETEPRWLQRLAGFCAFHAANAWRVQGQLLKAQAECDQARALWEAGREGDPGLLDETRVLGLQASLLRDQRELPGALLRYDEALQLPATRERPFLLLGKAKTLEESGEYELALDLILEALELLPVEELRQHLVALANQAWLCCHLEHFTEAESLLPEIRRRGQDLRHVLDSLRLTWLEGRIAKGHGQVERALTHLEAARQGFAAQKVAYDQALVTLEIAELLVTEGRTAEVKALARELVPAFQAQGVHAEAARALRLFHRASLQEDLTAERTRRMVVYLYQARSNPQMRFAPS